MIETVETYEQAFQDALKHLNQVNQKRDFSVEGDAEFGQALLSAKQAQDARYLAYLEVQVSA